jgi:hypothetical protein
MLAIRCPHVPQTSCAIYAPLRSHTAALPGGPDRSAHRSTWRAPALRDGGDGRRWRAAAEGAIHPDWLGRAHPDDHPALPCFGAQHYDCVALCRRSTPRDQRSVPVCHTVVQHSRSAPTARGTGGSAPSRGGSMVGGAGCASQWSHLSGRVDQRATRAVTRASMIDGGIGQPCQALPPTCCTSERAGGAAAGKADLGRGAPDSFRIRARHPLARTPVFWTMVRPGWLPGDRRYERIDRLNAYPPFNLVWEKGVWG